MWYPHFFQSLCVQMDYIGIKAGQINALPGGGILIMFRDALRMYTGEHRLNTHNLHMFTCCFFLNDAKIKLLEIQILTCLFPNLSFIWCNNIDSSWTKSVNLNRTRTRNYHSITFSLYNYENIKCNAIFRNRK